jgi:S1-C subfamily serine protease
VTRPSSARCRSPSVLRALLLATLLLAAAGPGSAGYSEGIDALNRQDYARALAELRPLAEQGHAKAQWALAYMYRRGLGVPKDPARADDWERRSARAVVGTSPPAASTAAVPAPQPRAAGPSAGRVAGQAPRFAASPAVGVPQGQAAGSGTGWLAAASKVVTNHHVVAGCRGLRVQSARGAGVARLVGFDRDSDLALLDVPALADVKPATLRATGAATLGEQIMFAGFPLRAFVSDELHVSTGIVSALAGPKGDRRYIQLGAAVQPGDSGGPVMDGSGQVIAVVTGTLNPAPVERATGLAPQNVAFAIRGERVRRLLDSLGVSYRTGKSEGRLDSTRIAERAKEFTVLVECLK